MHAGKASERSQRRFVPRCLSHAGQQPLVLLTTNRLADRAKGHRLRSHGGLGEQRVPFILSRPLTPDYRHLAETRRLRNFDIFDFALNGVR